MKITEVLNLSCKAIWKKEAKIEDTTTTSILLSSSENLCMYPQEPLLEISVQ